MVKHLFLILCGENEITRPRSKKLLCMLKSQGHYKIIVSGLSSFTLHPNSSESSRLASYLVMNGIDRSHIILEERSMDTLGNIIFSHCITELLLQQYHHIATITLITETFHLYRSQKLFSRIFGPLLTLHHIQSYFAGSENRELEELYRIQEQKNMITDFYHGVLHKESVRQYLQVSAQRRQRDARELAILSLLLIDFGTFHLHTITQFQNYLYSLPVYNTIYHNNNTVNISHSLYSRAIRYAISLPS